MPTFHVTFATEGRQPLFPSEDRRRAAVRALARTVAGRAVLFSIVDDHVHVVIMGDRPRAGRVARAVAIALGPRADAPLDAARIRPVENRSHLQWLVRYLLLQPVHHRLGIHPALYTGSCFPDLVGARLLPGLTLRIGDALPRFRPEEACGLVGLPAVAIRPLTPEAVRAAGVIRIVSAAAAVRAQGPELKGRDRGVVEVRRLAGAVAAEAGLGVAEVTWALGVSARTGRRLHKAAADTAALAAVRVRLALEDAVHDTPLVLTDAGGVAYGEEPGSA